MKDWICANSKQICSKLDNDSLTIQALGYLKLLFINEIILPESTAGDLTHLITKHKSVWGNFTEWLKARPFSFKSNVVDRLPMTAHIFTGNFTKMLKLHPLIFTNVPEEFRKYFIDICVFASDTQVDALSTFVKELGQAISWHSEPARLANVINVFDSMAFALSERLPPWIGNLALVHKFCATVIKGVVDKKIADATTVLGAIRGDTTELEQQL